MTQYKRSDLNFEVYNAPVKMWSAVTNSVRIAEDCGLIIEDTPDRIYHPKEVLDRKYSKIDADSVDLDVIAHLKIVAK